MAAVHCAAELSWRGLNLRASDLKGEPQAPQLVVEFACQSPLLISFVRQRWQLSYFPLERHDLVLSVDDVLARGE